MNGLMVTVRGTGLIPRPRHGVFLVFMLLLFTVMAFSAFAQEPKIYTNDDINKYSQPPSSNKEGEDPAEMHPESSAANARALRAGDATITGIKIISYGLFDTKRFGSIRAPETSLGSITVMNSETATLLEQTNRIPAKIGIKFGIRYQLLGTPNGVQVEHKIKLITPGLTKPPPPPQHYTRQGVALPQELKPQTSLIEQWQAHAELGKPTYDGFIFEEDWELVPGKWILQIWYKSEMLAEQAFDVYPVSER